ncbi:MAG TPA: sugar kinase [Trebonia sp.]|nr:sugar kinase [Trebonia sp.]
MSWDVVVIGEILVELSSPLALRDSTHFALSFSGDALNAAAGAAAAGASVAILTRVGDDEFGAAITSYVARLGIDPSLIRPAPAPNGLYLTGADPTGRRDFIYSRQGSAGSLIGPQDVTDHIVGSARSLLVSGITQAISASAAAAVLRGARLMRERGSIVVYDPNYRPRLTAPEAARTAFADIAPLADVVTPSWPGDATVLFGQADPSAAARAALAAGPAAALITLGEDGLLLAEGTRVTHHPAVRPPAVVDATGCGDALAGTLTARLALGDDLDLAVRQGMSAAARAIGHRGGTAHLPALESPRCGTFGPCALRSSRGEH